MRTCLAERDDCPPLWRFPDGAKQHFSVQAADGKVFVSGIHALCELAVPAAK